MTSAVRVNDQIKVPEVRTIDDQGRQIGVLSIQDAIALAEKNHLDLVEVAPDAKPPVCRIMDFGKYRYEQTKKEKKARKKQHLIKVKEARFHPNISDHDYGIKLKHIIEFLQKGNKVKVSVQFSGRELAHKDYGEKLIERLAQDVVSYGAVEMRPKMMGRNIFMTIGPVKSK
ncbi:MAG: translation initiation factor IF-3 [Chlamydiota bacterium]|nr:translation initiation factor IF-3 [Chlamydiota bacterium]